MVSVTKAEAKQLFNAQTVKGDNAVDYIFVGTYAVAMPVPVAHAALWPLQFVYSASQRVVYEAA